MKPSKKDIEASILASQEKYKAARLKVAEANIKREQVKARAQEGHNYLKNFTYLTCVLHDCLRDYSIQAILVVDRMKKAELSATLVYALCSPNDVEDPRLGIGLCGYRLKYKNPHFTVKMKLPLSDLLQTAAVSVLGASQMFNDAIHSAIMLSLVKNPKLPEKLDRSLHQRGFLWLKLDKMDIVYKSEA
jgi:hypothetical protein